MREFFQDIIDYEGLYRVSNMGNVYSIRAKRNLKPQTQSTGYVSITLCNNGVSKTHAIHRLVCESFIKNPENKPCVNHIDGIKDNNVLSNLEWCTYSENTQHAVDNGMLKVRKGKDHYMYGKTPHNKGYDSKIENVCLICESKYITYNNDSKYCSIICRGKKVPHNKGIDNRFNYKCCWCDTDYKTYKETSNFCSNSCKAQEQAYIQKNNINQLKQNRLCQN